MKLLPALGAIFILNIANAQTKVPGEIIGNWINDKTNNWEYGFFEAFAVYKNDFWEYEDVTTRNNKVWVTLRKRSQVERLQLFTRKDPTLLTIKHEADKSVSYRLQGTSATHYATPDDKPFRNSGFRIDTVTIIGYYRNLNEYLKAAPSESQKGPFSVSIPDFMQGDEAKYYADFDSLGRFKIKFPVLNTQQVYIDWGRLTRMDVVEPGERIFIFADLADYVQEEDRTAFVNRPKEIRFMGDEARIHNELAAYKPSKSRFNPQEKANNNLTDLEFQKVARSIYDIRLRHLEEYINTHPTVSRRFIVFQRAIERYQLLFDLMQHRFKKFSSGVVFDDGYIDMVKSMMDTSDETLFTLVRDYANFMRDYMGYHHDIGTSYRHGASGEMKRRGLSVSDADVLQHLKNNRTFGNEDGEIISKYVQMMQVVAPQLVEARDTAKVAAVVAPFKQLFSDIGAMITRLGIEDSLTVWRKQLLQEKRLRSEIRQIDSLIPNETLKQLLIARLLTQRMKHDLMPLSQADRELLAERITIQPVHDYLMTVSNHYLSIENKKLPYMASLKNTSHLAEAKNAELLFDQLISPYRGKVIYVDFWGTWCGPCREQMHYVGELKKELEKSDVIFMYLANKSPETSWINYIKQMSLTGENVVHYRLPDAQQAMIERKFSINSFPSYLLFDKNGNLALRNAPRPQAKSEFIGAINTLLNK